ncbi:MAG: SUMF1/EgtB/PvdO family nonheme iron enzyme [candidate division KSB1 bacterium]
MFPGRTALKALRPFDKEDAEIFQRLQRERELHDCLVALTDREFRLGILFGESGCGKTSFVQAGLWPNLPAFSATHFPIYVKFSELDPFVSVRHALREQLPQEVAQPSWLPAEPLTLMSGAEKAAQTSSLQAGMPALPSGNDGDIVATFAHAAAHLNQTLVLFFDQFEQFFLHFPKAEQRAPFIAALKDWYEHAPSLRVKILLSLRQDYYGHHYELQQALRYSLGPQDSFPLRKFSPKQAVEIFHVLAESASLSFDRGFVEEMTSRDLAAKEDGLISPVDIQILAWMASAQEDAGLNRTSFQKMGGVEGLLENYVKRSLNALAGKAEQQTALKVLLALIDLEHNLRAGALSLERIKEKLSHDASLNAEAIDRAIHWLASNKVRLITPVSRDESFGYELAHERLIQPLRRLTNKELSEVDQANLLLERRANEWLGNNRDRRYLLNWRELRRVHQQRAYLTWGQRAEEKQALLARSKRRFGLRAGAVALVVVMLAALRLGWPMLEKARQQRELAQQRQEFAALLQNTDMAARERVKLVLDFTKQYGDPRPEVTRLDSMQFCYVPPGPFWMGSADADSLDDYQRLHLNEHLNYGYWISHFPITVAQFDTFASDTSAHTRNPSSVDTPGNLPVVDVRWHAARRFCEWLTRKWRKEGRLPQDWEIRLPSEAEWEKAARGGLEIPAATRIRSIAAIAFEPGPLLALLQNALPKRRYPWGEQFDANLANSSEMNIGSKSAVGCFPHGQSPYGCEEMSGNVWEWTCSLYRKYPYDPRDGRENFEANYTEARALRGGSWDYSSVDLPCAARSFILPDNPWLNYGFRLVAGQSLF